MKFLTQLFLIPLLTGPIFMVAGIILKKIPPKEINFLYGYRTKRSMKSQNRWDFAQSYSAKEMIRLGFFLMLSSLLGVAFDLTKAIKIAFENGLLIGMVVLLFVRTERAIQQKFGKD